MAQNNNLRIKITAQLDEKASTKEIQRQLDEISKKLKLNVGIDQKQLKEVSKVIKDLQSQASKNTKGVKVVNDNDVKSSKQIFTTVEAAVENFRKMGQVKINKIFDPATQELKGFNLEVQKANGLIEKLKFESAKLKGVHGINGYMLTGKRETDNRAIEAEKALSRTIQNRAKEEKKAAEEQAKAINRNIEQKQKEIKNQEELNKKIQQEIELYQRSKQIQRDNLQRRYGDRIDSTALNNQMARVNSIDPRAITSMQQLRTLQRDIDLGWQQIGSSVRSSSSHVLSFGEAFQTAMVKFPIWMMASTAFFQSLNFFRDGITYVNELNKALTEISIVTGQSQAEVEQLGKEYQQLAYNMGVLTEEIAKATVEFYRQGLSQEQVMDRVSTATQYAKISALDFKRSAEILTATVNSMGVDITRASDVFSYLGDATATGADEIGIAFQRVGGTAGAVNVEFEKAASWIAVLSSRTREGAATIGNSIKSILARVQSMRESGFVEEDGTSVNQVAKALDAVNIRLMDSTGNFRNFGTVMDELGAKWGTLDNRQKAYLATTVAGTYQQSRFLNLMEGYTDTIPLYEKALKSAGTTQEKFNLYQQGTEAQLNRLKTTWQGVWQSSFDSDAIRGAVGTLDLFAKVLKAAIDTMGFLPTLIGVSATAFLALSGSIRNNIMQNGALTTSLARTGDAMRIASGASRAYQTSLYNLTLTARGASAAVVGLGTAIKTAGTFLSRVALPVAGFMLVGAAIGKVSEEITEYKQKQQEIKDQNDDIRKSYMDHGDEINRLVEKYEVLNSQVEKGTLSKDNEEYVSTANRLNEIFPIITSHLDAQGNAHLRNVDQIKQEVEYAEKLKNNYAQINVSNFEKSLDEQQEKFDDLAKEADRLKKATNGGYASFTDSGNLQAQRELIQTERELMLLVQNSKDYIKDKSKSFLELSGASKNLTEDNQKLIDDFIQQKIALADVTSEGFNFQTFLKEVVNDATDLGEKLSSIPSPLKQMFGADRADSLTKDQVAVLQSINSSVQDGYTDWEQYRKVLESVGFDKVDKIIQNLTNGVKENSEAIKENADVLKGYDDAVSNIESLNGIINDLNENQSVSADTISTMIEKYPELLAYLNDEATLRGKVSDLIEEENNKALDAIAQKLSNNEAYFKNVVDGNNKMVNTLAKAYNVDLSNVKTLAQFKLAVEQGLMKKLADGWAAYYDAQTRTWTAQGRKMMESMSYAEAVSGKHPQLQAIAEYESAMKELTESLRGTTSAMGYSQIKTTGLTDSRKKDTKASEAQKEAQEALNAVLDEYGEKLSKVDLALKDIERIKSQHDQSSKRYQQAIQSEIALLQKKQDLLKAESATLNTMPKISYTTSSGSYSGGSGSVTGSSGVSASQLNKYLKGKLSNMGDILIRAGEANGIDPAFLAAIAMHETGNGSSNAIRTKNNAFGIMGSNGLRSFSSVAESINYTADMLRRLYTSQGLTTVEAIQKKYAPVGVANDPTGLNRNWVNGVKKFWSQFTGTVAKNVTTTVSSVGSNVADYYLKNYQISSKFGENRGSYYHKGLDLNQPGTADLGDPIKSLTSGKVITAKYSKSAGYYVAIQQDDGYVAKYMHMMKAPPVKVGQRVSAGQTIGQIGDSGDSDGSHLHLQIEKNGGAIDPHNYLKSLKETTSEAISISTDVTGHLIQNQQEMIENQMKIEQLQLEYIKAPLYQKDVRFSQIDSHSKIIDARLDKQDPLSKEYQTSLRNQNQLLAQKKKLQEQSMVYIERELKKNKALTAFQRADLERTYLELRDGLVDIDNAIVDTSNRYLNSRLDALNKRFDDTLKKMQNEMEYIEHSLTVVGDDDKLQLRYMDMKVNNLIRQKAEAEKNIKLLESQTKNLKHHHAELEKNTAEIEKWKDILLDIDKSLVTTKKDYENIYNSIADTLIDAEKAYYEQKKRNQAEYYDKERERIKKIYDEELSRIQEVYGAKLDSIDKQVSEDDYNKQLSSLQKDEQNIIDQINKQQLDDSAESLSKILDLEEELANKREEIYDLKYRREIELRKESLNEQQKLEEDKLKESQDKLEEKLDKDAEYWDKYYDEILNDERHWAKVREEIMDGNTKSLLKQLETFSNDVQNNMSTIGTSVQNNLIDKIKEASDALKILNGTSIDSHTDKIDVDPKNPDGSTGMHTGMLSITKPINLWKRNGDKLEMVRILKPGEKYRVYGYDDKYGGQYNVGGGYWVTNMPKHVKLEKYHEGGIVGGKGNRLTELANKLFNEQPNEQTVVALKKELFAPEKNMPNFFNNIKNLTSSMIPKSAGGVIHFDKLIHIDNIDKNANINIDKLVDSTMDRLVQKLKPYGFIN